MLIKDLPTEALRKRAYELRDAGNRKAEELDEAFVWDETEEGDDFWRWCDTGAFALAATICPDYFPDSHKDKLSEALGCILSACGNRARKQLRKENQDLLADEILSIIIRAKAGYYD